VITPLSLDSPCFVAPSGSLFYLFADPAFSSPPKIPALFFARAIERQPLFRQTSLFFAARGLL
jgi:hypothetical protein